MSTTSSAGHRCQLRRAPTRPTGSSSLPPGLLVDVLPRSCASSRTSSVSAGFARRRCGRRSGAQRLGGTTSPRSRRSAARSRARRLDVPGGCRRSRFSSWARSFGRGPRASYRAQDAVRRHRRPGRRCSDELGLEHVHGRLPINRRRRGYRPLENLRRPDLELALAHDAIRSPSSRLDLVVRHVIVVVPGRLEAVDLGAHLTRSFASRFERGSSMRKACGLRTIARPWPRAGAGRRRVRAACA